MKKPLLFLLISIIWPLYGLQAQFTIKNAFPNLTFSQPIELISPDDQSNRIFLASQLGIIYVFPNNPAVTTSTVFLDMSSKVLAGGERGLLGITFHPDYKTNGFIYASYNRSSDARRVISRFKVSATNPNQADLASETVILTYVQPYTNHNGGKIAFGKDGYLYISTGDGGSAGDPNGYAQNRTVMLGKILRIDVDSTSANGNYTIPADNPYINNTQGYLPEIYAYGLRNPWKFSVDQTTGMIWAGDVGQGQREEVDIIVKGGNYGWKVMEGNLCYPAGTACNPAEYIAPIHEYDRSASGGNSITGGYVYRGEIPYLQGKYIYGDFANGNMWALTYKMDGTGSNQFLIKFPGLISTFGEDQFKELYVCNYSTGKIFKITDPAVASPANLIATATSVNSITLQWTDQAYNETNYVIERALTANGTFVSIDTLAANTSSFVDNSLLPATTYSYRIKAFNTSTSVSSTYSNIASTTTLKINQNIIFDTIADQILGMPPFVLKATANSGFPVSFTLVSGPATLSDKNKITVTGAGTVIIKATQEGNNTYNAAIPVERSFQVGTPEQLTYISNPADSATSISVAPTLTFKFIENATTYTVELNTKSDFTGISRVVSDTSVSIPVSDLDTNSIYYTRAKTNLFPHFWGKITSFKTAGAESLTYVTDPVAGDTAVPVHISLVSKEIPHATQYTMEINTKPDFSDSSIIQITTTNHTSLLKLDTHTVYYTRVKTNLLPDIWGPVVSFKTLNPLSVTGIDEEKVSLFQLKVYPNPVSHFLHIEFYLPVPATTHLTLVNALGNTVHILLPAQSLMQGKQQFSYDLSRLAAGMYVYQLNINGQLINNKIQIVR